MNIYMNNIIHSVIFSSWYEKFIKVGHLLVYISDHKTIKLETKEQKDNLKIFIFLEIKQYTSWQGRNQSRN